jgi:glycosyltransferase involved in cell wall biosynthesis
MLASRLGRPADAADQPRSRGVPKPVHASRTAAATASPLLVINGQGMDVSSSGGAGKYASELRKGLLQPATAELLSGCRLELINFSTAAGPETSRSLLRRRLRGLARRLLPAAARDALRKLPGLAPPESPVPAGPADWSTHQGPIILHELSNYWVSPAVGRLALSPRMRLLVTFHDIQDYDLPEFFDDISLLKRRMHYTLYANRADLLFADSEFTKETMVARLGIAPERIEVVHLAADDVRIEEASADARAWVRSLGRYLIYPAKAWPHKNHAFLLRALGRRRDALAREGVRLVLTGGFSAAEKQRLGEQVAEHGLTDRVEILGFQPAATLQALVRSAEYLVFPSLYEGFGMPILEAMTLGCPVLSSSAASLPEVGGDGAEYFDPRNEESFVALLDRALAGSIDREALSQRGRANCRRFSWEKTCQETIAHYRRLL